MALVPYVVEQTNRGERQYDIAAFGYGNTVFTDYGKDKMADRFVKYFAEDDWYGGFSSYLDSCEEYFELALYEEPYDVSSDKGGAGFIVAIAGKIMLMPGLGAHPAAEKIDLLSDGTIVGLS